MNKRQDRLSQIVDILIHNEVGSQEELMQLLLDRQCKVTQATLSRDLKTLRTSKVPTEVGGYRYILGNSAIDADNDRSLISTPMHQAAVVSLSLSGNLVVIQTRNGFAGGIASELDEMCSSMILGTIAGVNAVFVAIADGTSHRDLFEMLSRVIPCSVMLKAKHYFDM